MSSAARSLLDLALSQGATDVSIVPAAKNVGHVTLRRAGVVVESRSLTAADVVCRQMLVLANLDPMARGTGMQVRLGSCVHRGSRVRVTALWTQFGCSLNLRLHVPHAVDACQAELSDEAFDTLRDALRRPSGILVIAGPPSSGKTTRLAALVRLAASRSAVVASECDEIALPDATQFCALASNPWDDSVDVLRRYECDLVLIDEGVESCKVKMALALAPTHLVAVTLKAPDLAAAVHLLRLGVTQMRPTAAAIYADVAGILRTSGEHCRWFPFDPGRRGQCMYCGAFRTPGGACPGCGAHESPTEYRALSTDLVSAWPAADLLAFCQRLEASPAFTPPSGAAH